MPLMDQPLLGQRIISSVKMIPSDTKKFAVDAVQPIGTRLKLLIFNISACHLKVRDLTPIDENSM